MTNKKKIIEQAFISSIPIFAGYLALGTGFGMIYISKGFNFLGGLLMSIFIYGGSMQYVAIDLFVNHVSLSTVAITTLLVNARHLFYGISLIDKYKNAGLKKPYMIFALTDETYSLVVAENKIAKEDRHLYYFFLSLFNHIYWILGSFVGMMIGTFIKFDTKGMDFALTALFVTIVTDQLKNKKSYLPSFIGFATSLVCLLIFGRDHFLIPTMLIIAVILLIFRERLEK